MTKGTTLAGKELAQIRNKQTENERGRKKGE